MSANVDQSSQSLDFLHPIHPAGSAIERAAQEVQATLSLHRHTCCQLGYHHDSHRSSQELRWPDGDEGLARGCGGWLFPRCRLFDHSLVCPKTGADSSCAVLLCFRSFWCLLGSSGVCHLEDGRPRWKAGLGVDLPS